MTIVVARSNGGSMGDKGDYSGVSLSGTWYMVDGDEITRVEMTRGDYTQYTLQGQKIKDGSYALGNHVMELDDKIYPVEYNDERENMDEVDSEDDSQVVEEKSFAVDMGNDHIRYFFSNKDSAGEQSEENLGTNYYLKKEGYFDSKGFAIDGEGDLAAYTGANNEIIVPSEASAIAENAFSTDMGRGLKLNTVRVTGETKSIDSYAFAFANVEKVYIESGLQQINANAFDDGKIKEIHLPAKIPYIDDNFITNLKDVKVFCPAGSEVEATLRTNPHASQIKLVGEIQSTN